jgi:PAS domain S-box-containing protein
MLNQTTKAEENHVITESEISLFEGIPGNNVLILNDPPHFTILGVTENYLIDTGKRRDQLLGKGLFEVFPSNPNDPNDTGENDLRFSFSEVINHKKIHHLPTQRYDVANSEGSYEERYWNTSNTPILDKSGEVRYIIHSAVEITYQVKAQQREDRIKLLEQAHNLFMQAPIAIAILTGEEFVIELANEPIMEAWGKGFDIIGKPIVHVLPEIESQGFIDLMKKVVATEKPFHAYEMPATLLRNGKVEIVYFNFVYQPYYVKEKDAPIGIIIFANDVSEQVHSKSKVEESAQRVRSLVESAPFPIGVYVGREMRIELANQTIIDIYGKGPDVIGKRYTEILPELDNQEIFKQLDDVFTTGIPFHARNQRVDIEHNGKLETYYFNYDFTPLFDAAGKVYGVMNTAAEVTDLVLAKQLIEKNESNLRNIILQAPVAMCIFRGRNFIIELANHHMFRFWGKSEEEVMHKAVFEALPEAKDQGYEELMLRVLETGQAFAANEQPVRLPRDGVVKTVYINFAYEPIRESDDTISGIIAMAIDVTAQVEARKKIEESEQELQVRVKERTRELESQKNLLNNILVNSSNGISVTEMIRDQNGSVIDATTIMANEAAVKFTGLPKDIYLSKTATELDPDILDSPYGQMCLNTLRTGEAGVIQYFLEITGRWLELTISRMDDDHLIHIFTDVTPIKESQLQLERTVEELRRSNQNLEEFAYAASHDLKEPIRKIHFFSDRLKESLKTKLTDNEQSYFDRMEIASKRMGSLIDDLLSYSQVSLRPKHFEDVDLDQLITLVLNDLDLEIDQKDAKIKVGNLPVVSGHHRQLQQVFQNLLSNALKYNKPGIPPVIEITCVRVKGRENPLTIFNEEKEKAFWLIRVSDNGIGFEQRDAERIFNVFTRLHGNAEYRGTGVGLSIVRKVIENHNGHIIAKGLPGEGSVFEIYLPADK